MTYPLSATKLRAYSLCPQQFDLKYHHHLPSKPIRQPVLGKTLHDALACFYCWPGWRGLPSLDVLHDCWLRAVEKQLKLTSEQQDQGWDILREYYGQFVTPLQQWQEPIAVEGRLEGRLHVEQIEFRITGCYDHLECLPAQDATAELHLIDYKTSKAIKTPNELEVDVQLGLYQIAIAQRYGASLASRP